MANWLARLLETIRSAGPIRGYRSFLRPGWDAVRIRKLRQTPNSPNSVQSFKKLRTTPTEKGAGTRPILR